MHPQFLSLVLLSSLVLAQHQPRDRPYHRRQGGLLGAITARQGTVSETSTTAVALPTSTTSSAADKTSSLRTSSAVPSTTSTSSLITSTTAASSTVISSSAPASSSASATSATSSSAPVTTITSSEATSTTAETTSTTAQQSTNSAGGVVTVFRSISASNAPSASSSAAPAGSSGLSTGAIIGISVVAGVAALAAGLFLVFRLTSKRFSGFDEDGDDAIRWPELNKHGESDDMGGVALPARPTGGAGLRTNALDGEDSDDGHDDPSSHSSIAHIGMDPTLSSNTHSQEDYTSYPPQTNANYYDQQGGYPSSDSYDAYSQQQQGSYAGGGYPAVGGYGGYDDDEGGAQGQAGVGALGRSRSMGAGDAMEGGGGGMQMGEVSRGSAATGGGGGWASGGAGDDPYAVAGVSRRT